MNGRLLLRRIVFRFHQARWQSELNEELAFHEALKKQENELAGLSTKAAAELSRKQMGNVTLAAEESRDVWSFMRLERLLQDLTYAARTFAKAPAFTGIAILSLALGIGANAAMFSLVNALLIRPLPYLEPDRLLRITGTYPRAALPAFEQRSRSMEIAAVSPGSEYNLIGTGEAVRLTGSGVSPNVLNVLRAPVARGRGFQAGEDSPGRDGVVLLSDSLWRAKFKSDPATIGRVIQLNGVNREIVGIMPPGFHFPSANVQLWVPLRLDPSNFSEYWGGEFVPLIARLQPQANAPEAEGEIRPLVAKFRGTFPYPMARDWNANVSVLSLQQDLIGDVRGKLLILLSAVCVVLLIACVNVTSLLLSRATMRRKEMALRAALGAGRSRIIRQLLTESILLALLGGSLGIVLGIVALSIFKALLPSSTPGLLEATIDWPVVGMVTALTLVSGLAFGLAPALSASQINLTDAIRTGSARSTSGALTRFRGWLIAAEVALTLLLVVSAGLLIKSLYALSKVNPGFNPAHLLTVRISPNQSSCTQRAACISLYDRLLDRARGIDGVADAAVVNTVPLDGELPIIPVDVEGHPKTADHPAPMFWAGAISPGYAHLLNIPLLAGREFNKADAATSAGVVLISASTAKRFWPGENALGKHIKLTSEKQWRTVVGVLADVHQYGLSQPLPSWLGGALYMPYAQAVLEDGQLPAAMNLVVKAAAPTARVSSELRRLAEQQDPNVPVGRVQALEEIMAGSISGLRSTIRVFVAFAIAAMLLAAVGIYGLVSYWVTQRSYEIGLRVAIGATRQRIISMILTQGLQVTLYGIGIGIAAALVLTRFLASLLYGVGAADPLIFVSVAALLLAVAALAAALPAWRAARIDPLQSLKAD